MRGRMYRSPALAGGVDLRPVLEDESIPRWAGALNMTSDRGSATRTREGSSEFVTPATPGPVSVYAAHATVPRSLIVASDSSLEAFAPDGTSIDTSSTGSPNNGHFEWIEAPVNGGQGPLYGVNDNGFPLYFDGTVFGTWTASAGTLPRGPLLVQWELRTWSAGGQAVNGSSLLGSEVGNPRDWDTTNNAVEVQLDPSDGQNLSALGVTGEYMIVFKPSKTFVISDSSSGANRRLAAGVGCPARRSVVGTPYGLFFLSEDGVYLTDGNSIKRISDEVDPLLRLLSPTQRDAAAGCFFDDRYRLSFKGPGGAYPAATTLEYDPQTKAWWIHDIFTPQWAPWRRVDALELMGIRDDSAQADGDIVVRYLDADEAEDATSVGSAVVGSSLLCRPHTFGSPDLRKRCRGVQIEGSGGYSAAVVKDWQTVDDAVPFALSPVASVTGVEGAIVVHRGFPSGPARAWQVLLTHAGPMTIDSYTFFMDGMKN